MIEVKKLETHMSLSFDRWCAFVLYLKLIYIYMYAENVHGKVDFFLFSFSSPNNPIKLIMLLLYSFNRFFFLLPLILADRFVKIDALYWCGCVHCVHIHPPADLSSQFQMSIRINHLIIIWIFLKTAECVASVKRCVWKWSIVSLLLFKHLMVGVTSMRANQR